MGIFEFNCISNSDKAVLWAAAHDMTPEQEESLKGSKIIYLKDIDPDLHHALCHMELGSKTYDLAVDLVCLAARHKAILVQPAGSPLFQFTLGKANEVHGMTSVVYAHSERVSQDIPQEDGSVRKVSTFKHLAWVY